MPPRKKSKLRTPNLEEQANLREGNVRSDGHVVHARVEALIRRATPRYDEDWAKDLEVLARDVRTSLLEGEFKLESDGFESLSLLHNCICIPRPAKLATAKLSRVEPPTEVSVVGPWLLRTCVKPYVSLDLAATMPCEHVSITSKDYLNGRYWEKRAAYLTSMAQLLSATGNFAVSITNLDGDARKPILVVRRASSKFGTKKRPKPSDSEAVVRVLPCVSIETFMSVAHKMGPSNNCVRGPDGSSNMPTPRYNDALLQECGCFTRHLRMLHSVLSSGDAPFLGDAIVLAKVWLLRSGNTPRVDGISDSLISMLSLHVHRTVATPRSSAIELFRGVLSLLVNWDAPLELSLSNEEVDDVFHGTCPPTSDFARHFEVVFLDRGARVNLAARVSQVALEELKHDAALALHGLRLDAHDGAFDAAFPRCFRPVWARYDAFVRVPLMPLRNPLSEQNSDSRTTAWQAFPDNSALGEPLTEALGRRAASVVAKALEGRLLAVRANLEHSVTFSNNATEKILPTAFIERPFHLGATGGKSNSNIKADTPYTHVALGVRLRNDDEQFKIALRGPRPEETERARHFREFWGERAQLRRFRDGAVVEAVIWDKRNGEGANWKLAIPERAVRSALARHLADRSSDEARRTLPALRARLACATYDGTAAALASAICYGEETGAVPLATAALERLSTVLRATMQGDAPLRVDYLSPASPFLRYTSPLGLSVNPLLFPVRTRRKDVRSSSDEGHRMSSRYSGIVMAIDAIIRFEESAKWAMLASSPTAIRAAIRGLVTRAATTLLNAESIFTELRFVGFCPGVDSEEGSGRIFEIAPHLRVIYAGFAFRLTPYAPGRSREQAHGDKGGPHVFNRIMNPAHEPPANREIAFVHHSLIRALAARHVALSATIRLVSRWLHCQLFSDHVTHEVVELLVAAVFSTPVASNAAEGLGCSSEPPSSPINGFLRTLHMIWSRDWTKSPLWLDFRRATSDEVSSLPLTRRPYVQEDVAGLTLPIAAYYFEGPTNGVEKTEEAGTTSSVQMQDAARQFLRLDTTPEKPVLRLIQGAARDTERFVGMTLAEAEVFVDDRNIRLVNATFGRQGGTATKRNFDAWFVIRKDIIARGSLRVDNLVAASKAHAAGPKALRVKELAFANLSAPTNARSDAPKAFFGAEPVVDFVEALREAYGHFALFFYNALEPIIVGLIWRPVKQKKFSAMQTAYTQPECDQFNIVPNYEEILHDCAKLGAHIVESTQVAPPIIGRNGQSAHLHRQSNR